MARVEIVCAHCRQVNVRYHGWAAFMNPRWPSTCTLCARPLDGSAPDLADVVRGPLMWAAVYFLHAFVAAGLFTIGAAVLWPALVNQPASVRMLPMLAGIVVGLLLAERSRRAGSLLTKRRR